MNRLIKILSFLGLGCCVASISLTVAACDELGKEEAGISLSMDKTTVPAEAGSKFVTVQCRTEWTLDIDFKEEDGWASVNKESGKGNTYSVILSYEENTGESARSLELVLTAGNKTECLTFTQNHSGSGDNPGSDGTPDAVPGWMELPARQPGLAYYNHHFDLNGKRLRNYSLGWDGDARLAHWVAYPLCGIYTAKNVDRTDEWDFDPKVPRDEQPVLFKSYSHKDHDRGHQLPSADRLCSREANEQTFYFSNMTPQVGRKLNQAVWGKLEDKVRTVSRKSDTLYVVTGCIIGDSTEYDYDNNGNRCIVPTGYFKALLYYSTNGNTTGTKGYSGAAFYLENRSYDESNVDESMSMSIDDLEEMTGFDFFVNLPDEIEQAVEKEDPDAAGSLWW